MWGGNASQLARGHLLGRSRMGGISKASSISVVSSMFWLYKMYMCQSKSYSDILVSILDLLS